MNLNVTWSPRRRLHDHMSVHASRENSFATASFRAGARRITLRPLPRVWEFLSLEEPIAPPQGPRRLALRDAVSAFARNGLFSKKTTDSLVAGDESYYEVNAPRNRRAPRGPVCAKPFDATLHEDQPI